MKSGMPTGNFQHFKPVLDFILSKILLKLFTAVAAVS